MAALNTLAKLCDFKEVTAEQHREESIVMAFVSGLRNVETKRKILETSDTGLAAIVTLAQIHEDARENVHQFNQQSQVTCAVAEPPDQKTNEDCDNTSAAVKRFPRKFSNQNCGWCGSKNRHSKDQCPARDAQCHRCGMVGHFANKCRNSNHQSSKGAAAAVLPSSVLPHLVSILPDSPFSPVAASAPECLRPSTFKVSIGIGSRDCDALFDTGSGGPEGNYIHPDVVQRNHMKVYPEEGEVTLANTGHRVKTGGFVRATLRIAGKRYTDVKLTLLDNAVSEIVLGTVFLLSNKLVTFNVNNDSPVISALGTLKVDPPALFQNLTSDCHPIASRSRRYTAADRAFIEQDVKRLLKEGIIEKSKSPWRAQIYVAGGGNQKKRMTVDYSETINRFTLLDAYPLPPIQPMVNEIAQYDIKSTLDMTSAYNQLVVPEEDRPYTAFEACGGLYQFCRVPFGVTNGVPCFQRIMDQLVEKYSLQATFPYLDNITVCGKTQDEHDANLEKFLAAAKELNLTINESKCEFNTKKLHILGYVVENGEMRPDPQRLQPLLDLPPPTDEKGHKRILGLFSYYSQWIQNFSHKVGPFVKADRFPLAPEALKAFELLKQDIVDSVVMSIDESVPFTVETDASNTAIAATLNQLGRPVAFFSRTLRGSELKHASVEKEAQAIIEAVRHWRHFLTGRHFQLITDQKSVSFMFNTKHHGKIKNEKIMRWRMELVCYDFDIIYKPGAENIPPDTLSRHCASTTPVAAISKLKDLHISLSHPGVTRMYHFVRTKNLPYSVDDVRKVNATCKECAEVKPRFHKPPPAHLIKATQPFERLNLDFKGPLPSTNRNKYFLHVVDEFSRFDFVVPTADMTSSTIIQSLCSIFSMFGLPSYVHSDRGSSFLSRELRQFLNSRGIACSRTTPYNPPGNGQVEKYNHTIWRSITLALRSRNLPIARWQEVLPDVLHSVRTLLCTATNCTPHERMFSFTRKSSSGTSMPSWLLTQGPVLLRRFVRTSKTDPLVDEVELLEANPQYAHVRFPDGRESTVSVKDLAPRGEILEPPGEAEVNLDIRSGDAVEAVPQVSEPVAEIPPDGDVEHRDSSPDSNPTGSPAPSRDTTINSPVIRRSTRTTKAVPPVRLITQV